MRARLGQNFLASAAWRGRVAAAVAARPEDCILEIGGGRGELSSLLAESGARLLIIELDPRLAARLRSRFAGLATVQVLEADILQVNLEIAGASLGKPGPGGQRKLIGNLPYYISGPILAHLCASAEVLDEAIVMLQKEVAARVAASPCHREYGMLSVMVQSRAQVETLFHLPPGAFHPAPEVHSSLLQLRFSNQSASWGIEYKAFLSFLRTAFAEKRKRLWNNLKRNNPPPRLEAAWRELNLDPNVRAEQLSPAELAAIFRHLSAQA